MKTLKLKKILAVAVAAVGFAAVAAPKVTIDTIEDGDVWSTKKVTYTVSDVPEAKDCTSCYFLKFDMTAYGVTKNINKGTAQNGTFTSALDTAAIFGETRKDPKAKIRISVEKSEPVQLWENGPYFAQCNVGASKPEDIGYYFWWGDTVGYVRNSTDDGWVSAKDGKTTISFSNSDTNAGQTYDHNNAWLTNYKWIDGNGKLVVSDDAATNRDAARAHLGAPWRMMTDAELQKLVSTDYCTRTWVTSYYGKSVKGYVVKGAKDPYKNNEVFFPVTGNGCESRVDNGGSRGYYWSSAPNSGNSKNAWFLLFDSSSFSRVSDLRFFGFSVRPVR